MDTSVRAVLLLISIAFIGWLVDFVVKDKVRDSYSKQANIVNSLAIASTLKTGIESYYFDNFELPSSNYALGIPEPEDFRRDGLNSIKVESGGVIHITIDDKDSPKGGHIFLIPKDMNDSYEDRWVCLTPSYRTISQWVPQCHFKPVEGW